MYEVAASLVRAGKTATPVTLSRLLPPDIDVAGSTVSRYLARGAADAAPLSIVHHLGYIIRELARGREPNADMPPPPDILPYMPLGKYLGWRFEDINSKYLNWVVHNVRDEQVLATARYYLDLRAATGH
jgi:hypothetical protein